METHDGNFDNSVVYKDCHTLKDKNRKGQWITKQAKEIIVSVYIKMHFNSKSHTKLFVTHKVICSTHIQIYTFFFNFQERYIGICMKKGIDPKETHIHTWIEAVGGIRKNLIMGHPQLRASDIYGIFMLYLNYLTYLNSFISSLTK